MATLLHGLGRLSARRPSTLIAGWVVLLAVAVGAFVAAGGGLAAGVSIPGTETERVTDRLVEELPDAGGASGPVVFTRDDGGALDEQQRAADVDVEGAGLQRHDVPVPGPGRALEPAGI